MNVKAKSNEDSWRYIGFSKRLLAYNIDITVLMIPFIGISFFIEDNLNLFAVCFGIVCLYHTVLESSRWQGTLGKHYNGIIVVNRNKRKIGLWIAFVRVLLKFLSLFLLFSGFIIIYFRRDRRGLHDIILNTYVIQRQS